MLRVMLSCLVSCWVNRTVSILPETDERGGSKGFGPDRIFKLFFRVFNYSRSETWCIIGNRSITGLDFGVV